MKKMMMALALCLMSAISFAGNRQVSTPLPRNTPSVTLTIDGQVKTVKPTKATVKEKDDSHILCTVFAGKDRASVTLPISYDRFAGLAMEAAELAKKYGLISEEDYQKVLQWYQQQVGHM